MALDLLSGLIEMPLAGLGIFIGLFILVIIGSIIIMLVGALVFFIPAAIVAYVVWWLTGDHTMAGLAFLLVAFLSLTRRR
jgi:hypothetical protein